MSYSDGMIIEHTPKSFNLRKYISNALDDFVEFYDKFKRNGEIAALEGATYAMEKLAWYCRDKKEYKMIVSLNPKAADFLMGLYKNKLDNIISTCDIITMHDLQEYRKCFD